MLEMSNADWVQVKLINTYRNKILEILNTGGTIDDLVSVKDLGMGLRVTKIKETITKILEGSGDTLDKAQLIAEELSTI